MDNNLPVIRPFTEDDFEIVAELYLRAHIDEYGGESTEFAPEGLHESAALFNLFRQSNIFVYEQNATIKGFVGGKEQRIIWLYVDPVHRGQGIGRQMIDFMLGRLNGGAAISVVKSNQLALGMYQRLGFKVVGEFEFAYQGVPVKALSMQLSQN